MAQDNPNDTAQVEEPEGSTQVPDDLVQQVHSAEQSVNALGGEPIISVSAEDPNASVMDDAEDEIADDQGHLGDESEEREEMDEEAEATEAASNPSDSAAAQTSSAATSKSEEDADADERCEIEKQPVRHTTA